MNHSNYSNDCSELRDFKNGGLNATNCGEQQKGHLYSASCFHWCVICKATNCVEVSSRLSVDNKQHPAVADTQKMLMKLPSFFFTLFPFLCVDILLFSLSPSSVFFSFLSLCSFFSNFFSFLIFYFVSSSHGVSTNRAILEAVCSCVNDTRSVNFYRNPSGRKEVQKPTKNQPATDQTIP